MNYTTVIDGVTDNLAIHHNELKDGLQNVEALFNGKISVTVASNNITLALKTLSGADPTSTNFVGVKINGVMRYITSALSVTVNAAANTFNSGAAELAGKLVGYFPYLGYRAASSSVVIGFSRIPYACIGSDFHATATNEKYGAFSTALASGDDVENIGYFEATLSAGAGYTWSVPTFNSRNLKHKPTFQTPWLTWQPSYVGFSTPPASAFDYKYMIDQRTCRLNTVEFVAGTSNATSFEHTPPMKSTTYGYTSAGFALDNSAEVTAQVRINIGSNVLFYKNAGAGWTASGTKSISYELFYGI